MGGQKALLTIPRAAEAYGISESVLYRAAWARELPGVTRLGGRWSIKRPAFEAWLRDGGPDGTAALQKKGV